ncbi:hypothetical protein CHH55_23455 [Niallia circulans]|uniref:Eco57I restriction-modification methylase domain-containing protein n=1 Tax=Niallia circulans TaxID=1397 RepID=UPI000BA56235|nr:N-6 DNA methylase [Niallia circulans]PAD85424.1 hypothetical protein CHH55_23455 [Niallia circulans]
MVGKIKSLVETAEENAIKVNNLKNNMKKKAIGQFFTPSSISEFMADMSIVKLDKIKILDPGAGTGILSAALLEKLFNDKICSTIELILFESDDTVLPYLEELMKQAKDKFNKIHVSFSYRIYKDDFITYYKELFNENEDYHKAYIEKFDIVICNPPYYKVKKNHEYSKILKDYIHGQPNVYYMFMIISTMLLNENGQLIFITPRSYCSGSYFRKFRSFLFDNIDPVHFHLFTSRKQIFKNERVLQEIIILSGIKRKYINLKIKISSSTADPYIDYKEEHFYKKLIYKYKNEELIIRLPLNKEHEKLINTFDKYTNDISKMKIEISTGPVVPFRCKDLLETYKENENYPLFYMRHIKNGHLNFPIDKDDTAVKKNNESKSILIPKKNYIFIKRFTSTEQKRRLESCFFDEDKYPYSYIGIENHLNYLYKKDGNFSKAEMVGLYAFLNSYDVDQYFRIVNGNTQVNAYDIKLIPIPDAKELYKLGENLLVNKREH